MSGLIRAGVHRPRFLEFLQLSLRRGDRPFGFKTHPGFSFSERCPKKRHPTPLSKCGVIYSGDDLLSQDLSSNYHRRNNVSLPCSGWERVVPPCHDHQMGVSDFTDSGSGDFRLKLSDNCIQDITKSKTETSPDENGTIQDKRMISIDELHTLLRFHRRPINVVVFHDPSGKTYLGMSLALRCFQRLSLPHLATQRCP